MTVGRGHLGSRHWAAAIAATVLSLGLLAAPTVTHAAGLDSNVSQTPRPSSSYLGPDANSRIVGGSTTSAANFPWQAALVLDASFGGSDLDRLFCGGSLITPFIVLTAAHCIQGTDPDFPLGLSDLDPDDVDLIIGRTTLTGAGGTEHDAFATYYPASFVRSPSLQNDYGFISLVNPSGQARIDIVDRNDGRAWMVGAPTRVSGYGHTSQGGSKSDTLKFATVPIISDTSCGSPSVYGGAFNKTLHICAGFLAGGTDSCQGDSGGPLQTAAGAAGGTTRQVGIVSFGVGCAQPNAPGVYTRVAQNPLCTEAVNGVAFVENGEMIPQGGREAVVGPAGCSDTQFVPSKKKKKKCKKKKRKKGKSGVAQSAATKIAAASKKKKCKKKKKKR